MNVKHLLPMEYSVMLLLLLLLNTFITNGHKNKIFEDL